MINEKVIHSKFGPGVIVKIKENSATIQFDNNEERELYLPLVFTKGILTFENGNKQQEYIKKIKKLKEDENIMKERTVTRNTEVEYHSTKRRKKVTKNSSKLESKHPIITSVSQLIKGCIYTNRNIQDAFLVSGQGGMRKSNRTNSLVLISKRSNDSQRNPYEDRWINGILHYTGMGREGDQILDYAQNKTLANSESNGVRVYLFESTKSNEYEYHGRVRLCQEPYPVLEEDSNGNKRKVYKFPIELIN